VGLGLECVNYTCQIIQIRLYIGYFKTFHLVH